MNKLMSLGTESRKVVLYVPVQVFLSTLFYFGRMSEAGFLDFTKWGLVALFAGLTAEHFSSPIPPAK